MAFVVELAKPSTAPANAIPELSGGLSNKEAIGVDWGMFRAKVASMRIRSRNQVINVTGDGDSATAIEANLIPHTIFAFSGFLLAGQAIGLANLADTENNGTWATKIWCSSDLFFNAFVVVESVDIDWKVKDGPAVSVAILMHVTNTAHDELEDTLTTQE
jgi:hypothetical protein